MLNLIFSSESEVKGSGLKLGKFAKHSQEFDATLKHILPMLTACRPFPFALVLPAEEFPGVEDKIRDFESGKIIDQEEKKNYMVIVEGVERYKAHRVQKTKNPEKEFGFLFIAEMSVLLDYLNLYESRLKADVTE